MAELHEVRLQPGSDFDPTRTSALAHLYRGEVYRSTTWRTRLDNTTNWAVVTTGIALSATFSSRDASPLAMALVGLLVSGFLLLEARRYRYFYVWRVRARILETEFFAPNLLSGEAGPRRGDWCDVLAGVLFHASWITLALVTLSTDRRRRRLGLHLRDISDH